MYGPVAFATAQSVDLTAPGAPTFVSIVQPDGQDENWVCTIRLPEADADGGSLTGLTKLAVATATREGDVNPYEGQSMETILTTPNSPSTIITLDPATNPPGSELEVTLPITLLGANQQFAAACSDE